MKGEDVNFSNDGVPSVTRGFLLILWNCYKFFVDYANLTGFSTSEEPKLTSEVSNALDKWILARLNEVIFLVNDKLEKYEVIVSLGAIEDFVVNDFSTWNIRRSRDRVATCLPIMYEVLIILSKLLAPFTPFIAEEMYQNLSGEQSVHLTDYPQGDKTLLNERLVNEMKLVRELTEKGHAIRKLSEVKLRQPLASLTYYSSLKLSKELEQLLAEELNVKQVEYQKSSTNEHKVELDTNITHQLKEEGEAREFIRMVQQRRKEQNLTLNDKTKIFAPSWPAALESQILAGTASLSIAKGDEFKVEKVL